MSRRDQLYDAYYNNFKELLDNLSRIRINDSSLIVFKSSMYIYVQTYGVKELVNTMNSFVSGYTNKILSKDETFFLEELANDFQDSSFVLNEINKIREIWVDSSTTKAHKDIIWKHFIIFAKLGKALHM